MFNRCPFPLFRFLGFIICGTVALGDLGGSVGLQSLSLSLPLQCSVESVKQLVPPPLPPRLLSRTHTHTHARTLAPAPLRWEFALTPGSVWPQGTRVAGQTSTQLTCGTYHPRSSPEGGGGGGGGDFAGRAGDMAEKRRVQIIRPASHQMYPVGNRGHGRILSRRVSIFLKRPQL